MYYVIFFVLSHFSHVWLFATMDCSPSDSSCPWDSPDKNTGVGYHALLQGIFPNQESNPYLWYLLHCRQLLYHWAKLHLKKNFLTLLVKFLSLLNERIEKWSLSKAIWFLNFIHSVLDLCCCPQASLVVVGGAALQLCAQGSHCVGSCCAAWVVGTHAQ